MADELTIEAYDQRLIQAQNRGEQIGLRDPYVQVRSDVGGYWVFVVKPANKGDADIEWVYSSAPLDLKRAKELAHSVAARRTIKVVIVPS